MNEFGICVLLAYLILHEKKKKTERKAEETENRNRQEKIHSNNKIIET